MFFHYLSILAILPKERPKVLEILDTFGIRQMAGDKNEDLNKEQKIQQMKSTFNMMQSEAEKKLSDFKTFVDIPEQSKLLKTNTMMLELYVEINEDMKELFEYMNIKSQVK